MDTIHTSPRQMQLPGDPEGEQGDEQVSWQVSMST